MLTSTNDAMLMKMKLSDSKWPHSGGDHGNAAHLHKNRPSKGEVVHRIDLAPSDVEPPHDRCGIAVTGEGVRVKTIFFSCTMRPE